MSNITDFEIIAKEYAEKIAKEYGTKVRWVHIDGNQSHLKKQYPSKKLSWKMLDPVFQWDAPSPKQDIMFKQVFRNDASQSPKTIIKRSESKADTFSWSVTEGIKIGHEVKTKAGIDIAPISASVETTTSFEFNLSSTQGVQKQVTRSWEVDQEITQAPHSETEVDWLLDRNKAEGTFNSDVVISGSIAIWFEDKIDLNNPKEKDLHWLWFPSPATVIRKMQPKGFRTKGRDVVFNATGRITADVGLESRMVVREVPINTAGTNEVQSAVDKIASIEMFLDQKGVMLEQSVESAPVKEEREGVTA